MRPLLLRSATARASRRGRRRHAGQLTAYAAAACILEQLQRQAPGARLCPVCRAAVAAVHPAFIVRRLVAAYRAAHGLPDSARTDAANRELDSELAGLSAKHRSAAGHRWAWADRWHAHDTGFRFHADIDVPGIIVVLGGLLMWLLFFWMFSALLGDTDVPAHASTSPAARSGGGAVVIVNGIPIPLGGGLVSFGAHLSSWMGDAILLLLLVGLMQWLGGARR